MSTQCPTFQTLVTICKSLHFSIRRWRWSRPRIVTCYSVFLLHNLAATPLHNIKCNAADKKEKRSRNVIAEYYFLLLCGCDHSGHLAPSINKMLLTIVTLSPAAWQPGLAYHQHCYIPLPQSMFTHSQVNFFVRSFFFIAKIICDKNTVDIILGVRLAISFDRFWLKNNCL